MMKSFGLVAAIFSLVFVGHVSFSEAAETPICSHKVQGQLLIVGADSECFPSEYCFGMADYDNELRFRIGMYHLGDKNYTLSGIEYGQDGKPAVLSGSAVEIDDSLVMTVTVIRTVVEKTGSYIESKVGKIELDLKTSDVSFAIMDVKAYEDGREHIGDDFSNLNYIECP